MYRQKSMSVSMAEWIKCMYVDVLPILSSHIESIVKLVRESNRKSKPDTYVKWSLDMEDYYRIKDQEK